MPTWPASLPQDPLVQGFTETPPDLSIRSPNDVGPPKIRRRATAGVRDFAYPILLTKAQVETLDVFYDVTLKSGSLTFDHVHPRLLTSATFIFREKPTYQWLGIRARVTLSLGLMP